MTNIQISLGFRHTCKSDTTSLTEDKTHSQKDSAFKVTRVATVITIVDKYPNLGDWPPLTRCLSIFNISTCSPWSPFSSSSHRTLQSKPLLPIPQLPPSQYWEDLYLWSILDNPHQFLHRGQNTTYPPRGLRPWDTWDKESRNVFCPHSPYRHVVAKNRGRTAGMLYSCPGKV